MIVGSYEGADGSRGSAAGSPPGPSVLGMPWVTVEIRVRLEQQKQWYLFTMDYDEPSGVSALTGT